MRILGIDYGDVRTGIAVSDESAFIATPLKTHKVKSMRETIDYVASVAKEYNVEKIVVGLPLNMDGSEGVRCQKTRAFGKVLQRVCGIEVLYVDERLTSAEAEEILKEGKVNLRKNKELVDSMAARLILQSYFDCQ